MESLRQSARSAARQRAGWQFWIDRGGTFTDVIGLSPAGALHVRKVPSLASADGADPGLAAAAAILSAAGDPGGHIEMVKVGTTVATNALLTHSGTPVVLLTTEGFADGLRIGYQNRPDIFARHIVLPQRLYQRVIEVRERLDSTGRVLVPLDLERLRADLERERAAGTRALAIVFLHGWRHVAHERAAAQCAREMGFEEVSVAHELSPLVRYVTRADTTVLNAYLAAPLRHYVAGLQSQLRTLDAGAELTLMQSNGGLASAARFHAMASVLSGPAGGLIGMHWAGEQLKFPRLIGFDMGGTSTDVSLLDGELPQRFEHLIAGVRLVQPMLDVHSIAAGGGSILSCRDGRLAVGPDSAGADPGPAAYGRGGPLTLTDVQVLLGRLRADTLPEVFGEHGDAPIDVGAVAAGFATLGAQLADAAGQPLAAENLAESFLEVGVESMANAIRQVSTRRGLDAADFMLFCFGGAAGQHACRVARAAGVRRILVHPLASVLSALGIGVADRLAVRRMSLRQELNAAGLESARAGLAQLEAAARAELTAADSAAAGGLRALQFLELRAGESEITLSVPFGTLAQVQERFRAEHLRRFGFAAASLSVVIEALRAEARSASVAAHSLTMPALPAARALPATARAWFGTWREVPLAGSAGLAAPLCGPALIVDAHTTVVVEAGWRATALPGGVLLLEDEDGGRAPARASLAAAQLEIFNNLFMHIAEQMGEVLKATAQSVNIRERLDYSCALFDAHGGLVANAPHMPVHLGSMGASVRAVQRAQPRLAAGDSWLLNSPYHGGTHLPDMTVVTPVFLAGGAQPDFFVASRAHHADIGGVTPGSMPPFSRRIEEEGILFECFALVQRGELRERAVLAALLSGAWPARRPLQNLADLRAQLAANARGIAELERALARYGLARLHAQMRAVQDNAAHCMRNALARLQSGSFRYEMDNGAVIAVRIAVERGTPRALIDFTGTSAQGEHNFNAPRAVCTAAVLYVFRTLIEAPIPLNEGCLEPLEILIPEHCILDPRAPAAVAGGNVETSQCIVDALYGALGVLAASQGTMNNLTFGDERLQYYETIGGGAGAGPGFAGCDAVQTHMTNSRLTDPEILEAEYPVLVREFAIRRGSGGAGRYPGGAGSVRRLQFRAHFHGALLANHRRIVPFGLAGGGAGAPGAAYIRRLGGELESLGATARFEVAPGDELTILTPGGGGYGAPD